MAPSSTPGTDLAVAAVTAGLVAVLFHPRVRRATTWRALVTPLASIIGSGFLVAAPLLGGLLGGRAVLGMAAIVAFAYLVGWVLRFNILHAEPLLARARPPVALARSERWGDLALAFAYVTSVAFYIRLLAAFVLRPLGLHHGAVVDGLTTAVLAAIGAAGLAGGLHLLERLEEYAVNTKLAIIAAFLVALALYDVSLLTRGDPPLGDARWRWGEGLRALAGMLLIVQGFETSRYLGSEYERAMRVRSMRAAQWLSGGIYIGFVLLATPLLPQLAGTHDETAIIDLANDVSRLLGPALIVAAALAQFSAAVADTLGSGGLLAELSGRRLGERTAYAVVTALAIALVWGADIFAIIAWASRAFALYYALQCLSAWHAAAALPEPARRRQRAAFAVIGVSLLAVVLFAIPAEG